MVSVNSEKQLDLPHPLDQRVGVWNVNRETKAMLSGLIQQEAKPCQPYMMKEKSVL